MGAARLGGWVRYLGVGREGGGGCWSRCGEGGLKVLVGVGLAIANIRGRGGEVDGNLTRLTSPPSSFFSSSYFSFFFRCVRCQ